MFYGWYIVALALVSQAVVTGALVYSFSILVVPISEAMGSSRTEIMLALTISTLVSGMLSPKAGHLVDSTPMRRLMAIGVLMLSAGFMALSLTTAVWQIWLVFAFFLATPHLLMGALTTSALISRWFSRYRGRALGIAALGTSFGGLLFPQLLQLLISLYDWRTALLLLALAIVAVLLPVVLLVVEDKPQARGLHPDGSSEGTPEPQSHQSADANSVSGLLKQPVFWKIGICMGILFSVYAALLSNLVPFALGQGVTAAKATTLISIMAVFGIAGKLLFGYAADRVSLKYSLWTAHLLILCGFVALANDPGYVAMVAAMVLVGLAAGGLLPVWGAMLAVVYGLQKYGRVMGIMNVPIMVFALLAPPVASAIYDQTGDYSLAFYLFSASLVVSALMMVGVNVNRATAPQQEPAEGYLTECS